MPLLRLLTALAIALSGTVAVAVGSAPPAAAAIPGAELVWSEPTTSSSETTRTIAAVCPTGKRVLGAFAYVSGNYRDVVITALIPTSTFAVAAAREDQDGTTDNWQLTVQLICANPVPGLSVVSASSVYNSSNKNIAATCPAGKQLLTAGWNLADSAGEVFVNQLAQSSSLGGVSVTGMEDQDGFAGTWRLTTYAVCADPLPGLHVRTGTSATNSSDKTVLMVCDPGQQRLSFGWSLIGDGGGTPAGQVIAQPGSSGTGWFELIAREDDDGYSGNWYAQARILCITL